MLCVHTYVYIYIYIYREREIHYVYIYIYVYVYVCIYIYIHTYIHTYIHIHIFKWLSDCQALGSPAFDIQDLRVDEKVLTGARLIDIICCWILKPIAWSCVRSGFDCRVVIFWFGLQGFILLGEGKGGNEKGGIKY